jgi:hypothetical protein
MVRNFKTHKVQIVIAWYQITQPGTCAQRRIEQGFANSIEVMKNVLQETSKNHIYA